MAYRSMWNGAITFGLVHVPVKMIVATEDHDVRFRTIHTKDHGRIQYVKTCSLCGEVCEGHEIGKGWESDEGVMIQLTDEDLEDLDGERSREMEVVEFVDSGSVDPIMYEKTYYLEPGGETPRTYVLLRDAMFSTARDAVVRVTIREKARMGLLRVQEVAKREALILHLLRWHDEIRQPEFTSLDQEVVFKDAELKAAQILVGSLTGDWMPESYNDTRQEQLRELLEAKAGKKPKRRKPAPKKEESDVDDLLATLEASIAAKKARPTPINRKRRSA